MTSDSSTPPEAGSTGSDATSETESTVPEDLKIRWAVVVPAVLIAAAVLLVGLPLGAVLIMNSTGCCLGNGPEKIITFWASMIAGFLALFGMLLTGVFVITSLRVEATARAQAQSVAHETASEVSRDTAKQAAERFIRSHKGEMFEELERASDGAAQVAAKAEELDRGVENSKGELEKLKGEVTTLQNEAMNARTAIDEAQQQTMNLANEAQQTIDGAREQIDAGANEAQQAINGAREQTTSLASGAQRTIDGAREQITTVANEAQGTIDRASQQVEQQRGEAIGAIDNARQDVETAARAARDRIDRAGESPQGGDESR